MDSSFFANNKSLVTLVHKTQKNLSKQLFTVREPKVRIYFFNTDTGLAFYVSGALLGKETVVEKQMKSMKGEDGLAATMFG